jgi:hypothetical protein
VHLLNTGKIQVGGCEAWGWYTEKVRAAEHVQIVPTPLLVDSLRIVLCTKYGVSEKIGKRLFVDWAKLSDLLADGEPQTATDIGRGSP